MKTDFLKYCALGDMHPPSGNSPEKMQVTQLTKKLQKLPKAEATLIRDISPPLPPPFRITQASVVISFKIWSKTNTSIKLIAVITFQCTVTEVSGSIRLANIGLGKMSLLAAGHTEVYLKS